MATSLAHRYVIPVWRHAPLLRIVIPFMAGIAAGSYVMPSQTVLWIASALLATPALLHFITQSRSKYFGLCAMLLWICMGFWLVRINDTSNKPRFIGNLYREGMPVMATLTEPLVEKEKSFKAEARVAILDKGSLHPLNGRIILYLAKNDTTAQLGYGDKILFIKPLQRIKSAGNPGGFDYARYAARQGLYYQAFLKGHEFAVHAKNKEQDFQALIFSMRQWVLEQIRKYISPEREMGLAEALLIGYRGDLDKTLVEHYANSGVVHIIAISGMHLGLLYGLLLFVFRPLAKSSHGRFITAVLIVTIIWVFSLMTGAAPSITRAAIMFTLLVLGGAVLRKTNTYNALSAAAFIILMHDPFSLFNVGFQLSFAAVLSIAIFYMPIRNLLVVKSIWLNHVWQLMAVTIAAQILTMPLAVYHFHQFPTWFLLANLLAVPLSAMALYAIIACLVFSFVSPAAAFIGKIAGGLLWCMNEYILLINRIPMGNIRHLQWSIPMVIVMFLAIAFFARWLMAQSKRALVLGLYATAVFVALRFYQGMATQRQQKLVVYNVPAYAALEIIRGEQSWFLGDSALQAPGFLQNFHLVPSRIYFQTTPQYTAGFGQKSNYAFHFAGRKVLVLQAPISYGQSGKTSADLLIVTNNLKGKPARIMQHIRCRQIVLDGTNSRYHIAQWKATADSLHLRLHSVAESGAYVLE